MEHASRMVQSCEALVSAFVGRLRVQETSQSKHLKKKSNLQILSFITKTFKRSVISLLLPLAVGLQNLGLDIKHSVSFLPSLYRLLSSMDSLAARMPDVQNAELKFVQGKTERIVVTRNAMVESVHPIKQGTTSKILSIPGVSEMLLEFDPKTFKGNTDGSVILYHDASQQKPIPGASFTSMPIKPVKVSQDSVNIVYNSGYNRNWGFKVIAKALWKRRK
eukprot:TRINITY_DN6225_c0_g1_i1.p1 TRINITY_DN6225_c0_g1~~TRINITY_DN6225_c0_g1_i1.p1  ORF type:complete len:220 (-),score=15.33 TRINITY_DN6225_c0_g1_i1:214-873(-)